MANGRKVQSVEAGDLLREWTDSGEKMSSWCKSRGLSWYSLSAYKGWRAGRSAAGVAFVEVVAAPAPKPQAAVVPPPKPQAAVVPAPKPQAAVVVGTGRPRYRVAVGEVTVEVDDNFRPETLQRLLRAVAAC